MSYCKCKFCKYLWDLEDQRMGKIKCPGCGKSKYVTIRACLEDLIQAEVEELERMANLKHLHR